MLSSLNSVNIKCQFQIVWYMLAVAVVVVALCAFCCEVLASKLEQNYHHFQMSTIHLLRNFLLWLELFSTVLIQKGMIVWPFLFVFNSIQ